jgi:hypothetical protein
VDSKVVIEAARPVAPAKAEASPATQAGGDAKKAPSAALNKQVTGNRIPMDERQKTPERVALLQRLWHDPGKTRGEILAALNALPGSEIPKKNLGVYVIQWGIANSTKDRPLEPETVNTSAPIPTAEPKTAIAEAAEKVGLAGDPARLERGLTALNGSPAHPAPVKPSLETKPAAAPTISAINMANGDPVPASREAIQRWGEDRDIITGKLDVERVNARRRHLGLPPFALRAG